MTYVHREWEDRSLCAGRGDLPDLHIEKRLCPVCPVRKECFIDGTVYNEIGIWGGARERARRALPLKLRKQMARELWNKNELDRDRGRNPDLWYWIKEFEMEQEVQLYPAVPSFSIATQTA